MIDCKGKYDFILKFLFRSFCWITKDNECLQSYNFHSKSCFLQAHSLTHVCFQGISYVIDMFKMREDQQWSSLPEGLWTNSRRMERSAQCHQCSMPVGQRCESCQILQKVNSSYIYGQLYMWPEYFNIWPLFLNAELAFNINNESGKTVTIKGHFGSSEDYQERHKAEKWVKYPSPPPSIYIIARQIKMVNNH